MRRKSAARAWPGRQASPERRTRAPRSSDNSFNPCPTSLTAAIASEMTARTTCAFTPAVLESIPVIQLCAPDLSGAPRPRKRRPSTSGRAPELPPDHGATKAKLVQTTARVTLRTCFVSNPRSLEKNPRPARTKRPASARGRGPKGARCVACFGGVSRRIRDRL
jgi:hypothetical protein